jgi:hypothetical protein
VPYLHAEAKLVENWRNQLVIVVQNQPEALLTNHCPPTTFRIGIAWQGTTTYRGDRQRSVPVKYFKRLASIPGVRLISLQKGPGAEQLVAIRQWTLDGDTTSPSTVHQPPSTFDQASGHFMDSAAVMLNLDLVISSDTAVPHLAGALGVPVWVALSKVPDWRWQLHCEDSPWYPTMRLFRQTRYGQWEDVFEHIAAELEHNIKMNDEEKMGQSIYSS